MSGDDRSAFESLGAYAAARDALLARIAATLTADERVRAAWLSGSFGRAEGDEWADFDLHIAVRDADCAAYLDERASLYERVGRPLLVQHEMPSDSMPSGRFQLVIFEHALEVDWNIGPASKAVRPLAYETLIEREPITIVAPPALTVEQRREYAARALTFFWAMAPIAIKYAGRTETRRAVSQIGLLSEAFISLYRLAKGIGDQDPRLPATNRVLEAEIDARLPRLRYTIDPLRCLDVIEALCREVEALHPSLAELGATVSEEMPVSVVRLALLARGVASEGEQPRRTYR